MDPITGAGLILSLIPLFQRERDKREAATKEEFYSWLVEHKFQDVKDCITNNFELMVEIEKLLRENHEVLQERFNNVDKKLMMILHSVDGFKKIAENIAPEACLTKRQENLLRALVESGGNSFTFSWALNNQLVFHSNAQQSVNFELIDVKFLTVNLSKLSEHGFLLQAGKSYLLTEAGQDYVDNLDKKSEQEI